MPDRTRDQLAAGEFVEIFDDDVGIHDDLAVVEDQRGNLPQRTDVARIFFILGDGNGLDRNHEFDLVDEASSIAAIRILRAKGEASEYASFMRLS